MPDTPNPDTPNRRDRSTRPPRAAGSRLGSRPAQRSSPSAPRSGSGSGSGRRPYFPPRPRKIRPPALDVDALLAHANDPTVDLLAEAEAEAEMDARLAAVNAPPPDLTEVVTLRRVLRAHGLRPNKSFGQNFLVSRPILEAILDAADLRPEDNALEVGSGTGVLTIELARRARRVVAVELDRNILPVLRDTTASLPNVEIIPRDLLDVQPAAVFGDEPYKLVANLPYYITALTLRHFLEAVNPPRLMVIMVQKEVAERITAAPGDLSLLGLSVQFYGVPRVVANVPAAAFFPAPQVDSAIVRVDLLPAPPLTGADRDRFFALAHAGFAEKRKQIHNSLARNLRVLPQTVAGWLDTAGIDPMRRAETLSLDDWLRLTRAALTDEEGGAGVT